MSDAVISTEVDISDVLSILALVISSLFAILTIILNRRDKPNVMPIKYDVYDGNRLVLDFLNSSDFNIYKPTILINAFDHKLDVIPGFPIKDKLLFDLGRNSTFNYGLGVGVYATEKFFFRIRIKGKFSRKFPLPWKASTTHFLWYSGLPQQVTQDQVKTLIVNSYQEEIDLILNKHEEYIKNCEEEIDIKFN